MKVKPDLILGPLRVSLKEMFSDGEREIDYVMDQMEKRLGEVDTEGLNYPDELHRVIGDMKRWAMSSTNRRISNSAQVVTLVAKSSIRSMVAALQISSSP